LCVELERRSCCGSEEEEGDGERRRRREGEGGGRGKSSLLIGRREEQGEDGGWGPKRKNERVSFSPLGRHRFSGGEGREEQGREE